MTLKTTGTGVQVTAATVTAAAALLAKETAISTFLLLIALLWLKTATQQRPTDGASSRVFIPTAFLLVTALLLAGWRLWMGGWAAPRFSRGDNPAASAPQPLTRLLTFNHVYGLNLYLLLCPVWLCFDWALGCVPLVVVADRRAAVLPLLWTALLLLAYSAYKSARGGNYLVISALLLLLLPFLLSMNIFVHVGFVIAERNLYLSTAGAALLINLGRRRLSIYCGRQGRVIIPGLYAGVLAALLGRTALRALDWRSEPDLFLSGLAVCPGNAKAHYNLAKVRAAQHEEEETVLLLYKEAVRLGENLSWKKIGTDIV
jgi:hypothetical protein